MRNGNRNNRRLDRLTTLSYLSLFDYEQLDDLLHTILLKTKPVIWVLNVVDSTGPIGLYFTMYEAVEGMKKYVIEISEQKREEYIGLYIIDDVTGEKRYVSPEEFDNHLENNYYIWHGDGTTLWIHTTKFYR